MFASLIALSLALTPAGVHPLPPVTDLDSADLQVFDDVVHDAAIVALGESLHFTDEFSRARLSLTKRLVERKGFDVVAFEGSALAIWVAQDLMLDPSQDTSIADLAHHYALAIVWQTTPVRELFRYAREAQRAGSNAFPYFVAYDVQPLMSYGLRDGRALDAFMDRLARYLPADHPRLAEARTALRLFNSAAPINSPDEVARGISLVEDLIIEAAPAVRRAHPGVPQHTAALAILPANLRAAAELRRYFAMDSQVPGTYRQVRDRLASAHALRVRDLVSSKRRVAIWAHNDHIYRHVLGEYWHSVGSDVARWLGRKYVAIGFQAEAGSTYVLDESSPDPVFEPTALPPVERYAVERTLAGVCSTDCFVDFSAADPTSALAPLFARGSTRAETMIERDTIASRDHDAMYFVKHVTAPRILRTPSDLP